MIIEMVPLDKRDWSRLQMFTGHHCRWQPLLESGGSASITELAAAEKIDRTYLCRVLRLKLLAPETLEASMDGRQPKAMTLPGLMKRFPVEWKTWPDALARSDANDTQA